jgi:hypothetical protein
MLYHCGLPLRDAEYYLLNHEIRGEVNNDTSQSRK